MEEIEKEQIVKEGIIIKPEVIDRIEIKIKNLKIENFDLKKAKAIFIDRRIDYREYMNRNALHPDKREYEDTYTTYSDDEVITKLAKLEYVVKNQDKELIKIKKANNELLEKASKQKIQIENHDSKMIGIVILSIVLIFISFAVGFNL